MAKRIMVDMSATIIHHGHIRLLRKAAEYGDVIVGLTTDEEIISKKGYIPELDFEQRKEVLEGIRYVKEVVPTPWLLDESVLDKYDIDMLVHGHDNSNIISKERLLIFPRTEGISSTEIRKRSTEIYLKGHGDVFDKWNIRKKVLHNRKKLKLFKERDVLLMSIGHNVGHEQFGKGEEFLRPVVVFKKFNAQTFLAIPLSSKKNEGDFYFSFRFKKDTISTANFTQMKTMDIKRVKYKMGTIKYKDFNEMREKIGKFLDLLPQKEEGSLNREK